MSRRFGESLYNGNKVLGMKAIDCGFFVAVHCDHKVLGRIDKNVLSGVSGDSVAPDCKGATPRFF